MCSVCMDGYICEHICSLDMEAQIIESPYLQVLKEVMRHNCVCACFYPRVCMFLGMYEHMCKCAYILPFLCEFACIYEQFWDNCVFKDMYACV